MSNPGLSSARLVDAALEIIDEAGVESLTMKRLAERLGVSAMAAYKHVRDKDALLVLAADDLVGRQLRSSRRSIEWEHEVRRHVRRSLQLRARHPWASDVLLRAYRGRTTDTPNVAAAREQLERTLGEAGFGATETRLAQSLIQTVSTGLTVTASYRARGLWAAARGEPSDRAHEEFATAALLSALRELRARPA